VNILTREASRYFMIKKKEYLKAKIDELENNSKIKLSVSCLGASVTLRRVTFPAYYSTFFLESATE